MQKGFLPAVLFCLATCVAGETVETQSSVNAFDPTDPSKQLGVFQPGSKLEVGDYVESAKMYQVIFKAPDGAEIHALCAPSDLGKAPGGGGHSGFENWKPTPDTKKDNPPDSKPKEKEGFSPFGSPSKEVPQPPLFDSIIQLDPVLWDTTASNFALKQGSFGFRWVSSTDQDSSRSATPLSFLSQPIMESLAFFKEGKLEKLQLLLFGRGDAKVDMGQAEFNEMKKKAEGSLDDWLKTRGLEDKHTDAMGTTRESWFKFPLRVDLETSVTQDAKAFNFAEERDIRKGFRTEFVRLVFTPYDGKQDPKELTEPNNWVAPQNTTIKISDFKSRVKHDGNGDVYLDGVPMVDQGQKGYCVVASAERVMRYYGLSFDQNELAKEANSGTEGGTNTEEMFKALKKIGGRFGLNVQKLMDLDLNAFLREVDEYNRVAPKGKKVEVIKDNMIQIGEFYEKMDSQIFRKIRLKEGHEKNRLEGEVEKLVDSGAPALWSVSLGIVQETPELPQTRGNHMRLIIGYNKKTSEIIYTDSWGAGHEFKHMSLDSAYVITQGLYSVVPSAG